MYVFCHVADELMALVNTVMPMVKYIHFYWNVASFPTCLVFISPAVGYFS
jgi:hypothetical protein